MAATTTSVREPSPAVDALEPVRWRTLLIAPAVLTLLLFAVNGRHGYHIDELYTRVASQHLAWGYVDQPPLVVLIARLEIMAFGDNLWGLRVFSTLLAAATVVLLGLVARELGASPRVQVFATIVAAATGVAAHAGHILGTHNVDLAAWVAICWLLIRMVRTGDRRLWLAIGAVTGIAVTAKYLVVLLLVCLALAMLVVGPRQLMRSRHLPLGAAIAVVVAAPVLVWQVANGLPQLEMAAALSTALEEIARISFLPLQFLLIGVFLAPVWIAGLVALLRRRQWRPYRFLSVAYLIMAVLLLVVAGQSTYMVGLQLVMIAAGSVVVAGWARTVGRRLLLAGAVSANVAASAILMLPFFPLHVYAENPALRELAIIQFDQAGWPELTAAVADVYHALPPADRADAVIFGNHYAQAGAVDRYGDRHGLPPVYSGHNSYADFGTPADDKRVVVTIGVDRAQFEALFARCEPRGNFEIDLPVPDRGQEFMVCYDPHRPWSRMWSELRWIGFQCPYNAKAVTAASEQGCV